ncbi:NAD(P)H-dependent oxidoreductase [Lentzea sp. NPDC051208]|uniref:NADPH-dependent FMN reductase n=1 Tax=Lentzea sp. NPDC051208 TaxID=3154642 RepID=UPI0034249A35
MRRRSTTVAVTTTTATAAIVLPVPTSFPTRRAVSPAVLQHVFAEWNNKAVGFVSYGSIGGARAVEHLRLVAGELKLADVRTSVSLSMFTEFTHFTEFHPSGYQAATLSTMFDELVAWSSALAPLRDRQLTSQRT